jgi:hypothetical protein
MSKSKRLGAVIAAAAILSSQAGCYTTKVVSQVRPEGPSYSDRQWFTLGGLVPLSGAAGRECQNGLSTVESRMSATDWLINVGLGVAGGLVGGFACAQGSTDPEVLAVASTSCGAAFSTLVPFLIGSRTVEYTCAEGPESPNFMPSRRGDFRPEAAPGQDGAPPPAPTR